MIDLARLETFVTVIRAGSFARAARVLGLTPAMVGRRIQAIEDDYGLTLIERTTRSQHLTAAGEALLHHAEHILGAAGELEEAMRQSPSRLEGRIRLTAPATLGVTRLAGTIARFADAHPAIEIEAMLADRRADLVAEGYDFAVRIGDLRDSSMIGRRVGTYALALVATPGLIARNGAPASPADLARHRCLINLNMVPRNRWPFRRDGRLEIAEVEGSLRIDNGEALRAATLEGAGIAYLPIDLVRDDLATGRLIRVLPDWQTSAMPIWIVQPGRRIPLRVQALIAAISADLSVSHPLSDAVAPEKGEKPAFS